jgi:hypothetical protein
LPAFEDEVEQAVADAAVKVATAAASAIRADRRVERGAGRADMQGSFGQCRTRSARVPVVQ